MKKKKLMVRKNNHYKNLLSLHKPNKINSKNITKRNIKIINRIVEGVNNKKLNNFSIKLEEIEKLFYKKGRRFIYFLVKENKIVYIGKTKNLIDRILIHIKDPLKDFDIINFIEIDKNTKLKNKQKISVEEMSYLIEIAFIKYFNPEQNQFKYVESSLKGDYLELLDIIINFDSIELKTINTE